MEFHMPIFCVWLLIFSLLSYHSQAYVFNAGGKDGWVLNPSEEYNHWAGRNRFQVNDTIVFKYKKGSNSVLVVNKDDYDKCNKTNPIKKYEDGDSTFKFDKSGPFYFISGTDINCEKGQKLIVVVLAIRSPPPHSQPPVPAANPPSPATSPKISPPSPSPSPSVSPTPSPKSSPPSPAPANSPSSPTPATSPAPAKRSPVPSPANSPTSPPPAPSVSPIPSPKISPAPANSSPAKSPANSPTASSPAPISSPIPSPKKSPAPASPSPANSPTPSPPAQGSPPSSQPGPSNPSSSNDTSPAPAPRANGAWGVTPASLLVYVATILISVAMSGILGGH